MQLRSAPMQEDEMIEYIIRGLHDYKHLSVIFGKDIAKTDENSAETNRIENESNPTPTLMR
jgi:hypothetical protein